MAEPDVSCVVLAGGRGARMGVEKAWLPLLDRPLIEWALAGLAGLAAETLIVTADPFPFRHLGCRVLVDEWPEGGALGALYTGLWHAQGRRVLMVGCDMPFLQRPVCEYLLALVAKAEAVVPRTLEGLEPLHAVYTPACLSPLAGLLQGGCRRLGALLEQLRVRYVEPVEWRALDPAGRTFFNINTPADLERARQMAGEVTPAGGERYHGSNLLRAG